MCGNGYSQREGIDYQEKFAPVVRYTSLRYLIGLAVKDGYKIFQMDAICFLYIIAISSSHSFTCKSK